MMDNRDFKDMVVDMMSEFLGGYGFKLEEDGKDSSSLITYVIYKSSKAYLKIYNDLKNGEINCNIKIRNNESESKNGAWCFVQDISGVDDSELMEKLWEEGNDDSETEFDDLVWIKEMLNKHLPHVLHDLPIVNKKDINYL